MDGSEKNELHDRSWNTALKLLELTMRSQPGGRKGGNAPDPLMANVLAAIVSGTTVEVNSAAADPVARLLMSGTIKFVGRTPSRLWNSWDHVRVAPSRDLLRYLEPDQELGPGARLILHPSASARIAQLLRVGDYYAWDEQPDAVVPVPVDAAPEPLDDVPIEYVSCGIDTVTENLNFVLNLLGPPPDSAGSETKVFPRSPVGVS